MVAKYTKHYGNSRSTAQTQPIPGREAEMVKNNAGGYVFTVDPMQKLQRFLILGTEGGSYYADEAKMTVDNAQTVMQLIKTSGPQVVEAVRDVSVCGKAYKQDPTLYVLALAFTHGDEATKALIKQYFTDIVRIGTHLFMFVQYVKDMRGWGKSLRQLVASWYAKRTPEQLAHQVTKYQQRNGMSHRDLIRLAHPVPVSPAADAVFRWVVAGKEGLGPRTVTRFINDKPVAKSYPAVAEHLPQYLHVVDQIRGLQDVSEVVGLVQQHNLPREVIPTEALNDVKVWDALLPGMPPTAMIRNLGKMTSINLLKPLSKQAKLVVDTLVNAEALKKARVHPIQVLAALLTYQSGHGVRGALSWTPNQGIVDALDRAFYLTFKNVEPTNKRIIYALDLSASMTWSTICGVPGLTPRVAAAAMSLVLAAREPHHHIMGFSSDLIDVPISPRMRLDDAVAVIDQLPAGATNCALPMMWAMQNKIEADAFVVITDNETWHSAPHPIQALQAYRKQFQIPARLAVVGMTATDFSIADPKDPGTMDFVGFSTDTPAVLSDFIRGAI